MPFINECNLILVLYILSLNTHEWCSGLGLGWIKPFWRWKQQISVQCWYLSSRRCDVTFWKTVVLRLQVRWPGFSSLVEQILLYHHFERNCGVQPALWEFCVKGKLARLWNWPLNFVECWDQEFVSSDLHVPHTSSWCVAELPLVKKTKHIIHAVHNSMGCFVTIVL